MSVELYNHNKKTYDRMINMFKTDKRVGIVQPTGTGKSFIILKWIEDNIDDDILVLSPSGEIFNQLYRYADSMGLNIEKVNMISYQKLIHMSFQEIANLQADKIIVDEFHRIGADKWNVAVRILFALNETVKILGLTATPIRYLDKSRNMLDEIFNNNIARYMTLGEAVEREILHAPTYIPVWYDADDLLLSYQDNIDKITDPEAKKEAEELLKRLKYNLENSYGAEDIFKKYIPTNHGKYIVFCRNEEHIEIMKEQMVLWLSKVNKDMNINEYVTLANMPDKDEQIKMFINDSDDSSIKLLFTIDRLNEGLHVEGIDGIIMLRPTTSPIVYLQQMGRALSVSDKTPLIFDMVNNYQNVKVVNPDSSEIQNVFEKEIYESVKDRNVDTESHSFQIFEKMIDFNNLFKELESRLLVDKWKENFKTLKIFITKYNRMPKKEEIFNDIKIGSWLTTQKRNFDKGNLSKERQEKLESIGISLKIVTLDERWKENFKSLKEFIDKHNRLPSNKEFFNDIKIGSWLNIQKRNFDKGNLSKERQEKLESIGVEFIDLIEKKWEENFKSLKEFINKYNRLPKQNEIFNDIKIGIWFSTQKTTFKKGKLSKERQEKLESVTSNILNILDERWEENFKSLKEFINKYNRMPKKEEIFNDIKIGIWFSTQKTTFKKGKLSKERQEKLESIGVVF